MRRARVTPPLPDQSCAILDTGDQVTRLCRREIGSLQAQGRQVVSLSWPAPVTGKAVSVKVAGVVEVAAVTVGVVR